MPEYNITFHQNGEKKMVRVKAPSKQAAKKKVMDEYGGKYRSAKKVK